MKVFGKNFISKDEWFPHFSDSMSMRLVPKQEETIAHFHECCELVIIFSGRAVHYCDHVKREVGRGDVLFIPQGSSHSYLGPTQMKLANLLFIPLRLNFYGIDIAESPLFHAFLHNRTPGKRHPAEPVLSLGDVELRKIGRLVNQFKRELRCRELGHQCIRSAIFMMIMTILVRAYKPLDDHDPGQSKVDHMSRLIAYLQSHFASEISLALLCKKANLSRTGLIELFKKHTGKTPIQFLLHLRIVKAAALLRETNDPVSAIAFRCGFTDCNYFSRQFKKITGQSPRAIRS